MTTVPAQAEARNDSVAETVSLRLTAWTKNAPCPTATIAINTMVRPYRSGVAPD